MAPLSVGAEGASLGEGARGEGEEAPLVGLEGTGSPAVQHPHIPLLQEDAEAGPPAVQGYLAVGVDVVFVKERRGPLAADQAAQEVGDAFPPAPEGLDREGPELNARRTASGPILPLLLFSRLEERLPCVTAIGGVDMVVGVDGRVGACWMDYRHVAHLLDTVVVHPVDIGTSLVGVLAGDGHAQGTEEDLRGRRESHVTQDMPKLPDEAVVAEVSLSASVAAEEVVAEGVDGRAADARWGEENGGDG